MSKQIVKYITDQDGFIVIPEISDARLVKFDYLESAVLFVVETGSAGKLTQYEVSCINVLALRIDRFTKCNISLDFFVSASGDGVVGMVSEDIMTSLFEVDCDRSLMSLSQAREKVISREAILFGNEPSCGCELAVLCERFEIYEIVT